MTKSECVRLNKDNIEISIVIPTYNEERNIDILFSRLLAALSGIKVCAEIVFVDDGSNDSTVDKIKSLISSNSISITLVVLNRNFGKDIALTAGLAKSYGKCVIPMDADLQHPPELIPDLYHLWKKGHKVVLPIRASRSTDSKIRTLLSNIFYNIINKVSSIEIVSGAGDFRLLDREVVDVILSMPERSRFMKGLFAWPGYPSATLIYEVQYRGAGSTSWNYWKLWNFALDGIFSFSTSPLRVWTYIGSFIGVLSFIYMSIIIFQALFLGVDVPGYASTLVSVTFFGGINLIGIGVLGEYIGRIFEEVKGRPLYVIKEEKEIFNNSAE